jgi:hypothetical protein
VKLWDLSEFFAYLLTIVCVTGSLHFIKLDEGLAREILARSPTTKPQNRRKFAI